MDSASNELHLTPENIRDIQELVLLITPDFREELWERVSLTQAREREKQEATVAAMQQMMNQSASSITNALAQNIYNSSSTAQALMRPGALQRVGPGSSGGSPIWTSYGTGFSPYGPLNEEMGLTLSRKP